MKSTIFWIFANRQYKNKCKLFFQWWMIHFQKVIIYPLICLMSIKISRLSHNLQIFYKLVNLNSSLYILEITNTILLIIWKIFNKIMNWFRKISLSGLEIKIKTIRSKSNVFKISWMFIKEIKIVKFNKINNILEISVKSLSLKKVILHYKNKL